MIEATCPACGTLNRVSEANVPVGARFMTCADCKSRVAIAPPPPTAAPPKRPPAPNGPIPVPPPAKTTDVIDLADLPAPKRASALGPIPLPPTPRSAVPARSVRSGLAAALDPELPAPKAPRAAAPVPRPSLDLDDLLGTPAPDGPLDGVTDLPAPKRAVPRPPPELAPEGVIDLPAPRTNREVADLPAPKRAAKPPSTDLPMPSPSTPAMRPLPSPADLPTPPSAPGAPHAPKPKGPLIPDLPAPRVADVQARALAAIDLPAPKGFFDDLPQPALHDRAELPAPKGFFDDLPQPALHNRAELPAPKGYFENLPQVKSNPRSSEPEVPAPKGFFDDIPGLPHTSKPEAPAPKGYFDNVPALPHTNKPEAPAPKGYFDNIPALPHTSKPEVPAPQGYFDNIPGRPATKTDDLAPKGFFDDLPQPGRPAQLPEPGAEPSELPEPGHSGGDLRLDAGPELELVAPSNTAVAAFDDLDLSSPSASPVRFEPPRATATHATDRPPPMHDNAMSLELEGSVLPVAEPRPAVKRPVEVKPALDEPSAARKRTRRNQRALAGLLAAVVLGGGGVMLYKRHAAAQRREATIAEQLGIARTSYAASDAHHWQRAAAAARNVIELDSKNPDALGIAAESLLASALGDGTAFAAKLAQARGLLEAANAAGISSPQLARARALSSLAARQADVAFTQLQTLVARAPDDAALALYLGWALAAKGANAEALTSYDRAAAGPAVKLAALYGRGNARLALADLAGARTDFSAALELDNSHIGAQVGLAAAQPPSATQQQESDLLAILARKDIAQADPRAVALAWSLAGDAALRAGRSDVARERFRNALGVVPQDVAATTGLAETELRDGKLSTAAELIAGVLVAATDSVPAQLLQSEIEIKQNKLPLAAQRLAALANHGTPLAPRDQAQLHLVTGKLLEAQGQDDAAVEAYALGAKAAGDLDLTPLMAAVGKLAAMTEVATQAKDAKRADQLRARADQLLSELAEHAERDPRLAMTLGMAYLQEGDAVKADTWLRKVVDARPGDAEARFQRGRALLKIGKAEDALESLKAALGIDPARSDIGAELARAYEALGHDADALALYTKLIAGKDPSIELRGHAGRFFARSGAIDRAAEQGAKILAIDPRSASGLYLKGEGLLSAGKPLEAKQVFQRALEIDRDPQYFDALGRAAEALAQGGDRELQDLAIRSYLAASEAAPTMFNPLAGQGRLYVARHEAAKAVRPLLDAGRLQPNNADILFLLGAAYQELQQTREALRTLEASARITPRADAYWRISQIYRDANQGPPAAAAVSNATRLAAELERRTGKPVAWLTEALYLQGRVNFDLHKEAGAREAWTLYVARNPPPSAQLTEVKQLLATSLRR